VVGQKDPLLEFKHEAFALFDTFSQDLKLQISHALFRFAMQPPPEQQNPLQHLQQQRRFKKDAGSGLYLPNSPIKTKKQ